MQCRYGGKLNAGIYIYKSVCGWCLDEAETGIRVSVSDGIEWPRLTLTAKEKLEIFRF